MNRQDKNQGVTHSDKPRLGSLRCCFVIQRTRHVTANVTLIAIFTARYY